jgi:hypothetical protein
VLRLDQFFAHRQAGGVTLVGHLVSIWVARGFMTRAGFLAGQMSAQLPQPMQSSAKTWMRNLYALSSLPRAFLASKPSGAAFQFILGDQHRADGRVGADHGALVALDAVLHDPFGHVDGHARAFHTGWCPPEKCRPARKALTGSLSPCWASMGFITSVTQSGSSPAVAATRPASAQAAG